MVLVLISIFFVACSNTSDSDDPATSQTQAEQSDQVANQDEGTQEDSQNSELEPEPEPEPEPTEEEILALAVEKQQEQDAKNKANDGIYYVPLPEIQSIEDLNPELKTVKAKALYVTSNIAGFNFDEEDIKLYADHIRYMAGETTEAIDQARLSDVNRLEEILGICMATEINALVIDVKNDHGHVGWKSDIQLVQDIDSHKNAPMKDYERLLTYMDEQDIYSIARVVAFKDPYYAEVVPEHTIQLNAGGTYRDKNGTAWVNPFDPVVWDYVVAVSKEAALRGFKEIQYDYVRFPDNAAKYNPITHFPERNLRDKDEGIEDFLKYANNALEPYNVHISVDVFAQASRSWDDHPEDIGQTWRKMANLSDYICPMIYPSHYGENVYGFAVPDQHPYDVVRIALQEAIERNSAQKTPGIIRPWIQGFTAGWIPGNINYDANTIAKQIIAATELGIDEYIIWDAGNTYDPMIFFYHDQVGEAFPKEGQDMVGRTAEQALDRYLTAERYDRKSQIYLLTPKQMREEDYDDFAEALDTSKIKVESFDILSVEKVDDENYTAKVDVTYSSTSGNAELVGAQYKIIMEDGVFKIVRPKLEWVNPEDFPLGLVPNEMGRVMVLMYHNIGSEEATWTRTPENFKKDLNTLYEKGYRPISLKDYASGNITTQAGYTPVVITVDDTNKNNFFYTEDGEIAPDSFVGIFMDFHKAHPDFPLEATFFADGPTVFDEPELEKQKVDTVIEAGMDISNHTLAHASLRKLDSLGIQEAIGQQAADLEKLIGIKDYKVNTLALPYGERPSDDVLEKLLLAGTHENQTYENIAVLNVGWNPAYSPYDERFSALSIPRIRASEMNVDNVGMYNYIEYFDKNPGQRFISDGKP